MKRRIPVWRKDQKLSRLSDLYPPQENEHAPQNPDPRDLWRQASAEAIFKALIPGWKAAEK